jgi:hypothetical protein
MTADWSFDMMIAAAAIAATMALWWIGYAITFAPF